MQWPINDEDPLPLRTEWAELTFGEGRTITAREFESVTARGLERAFRPDFEQAYLAHQVNTTLPPDCWWEGLNAVCRFWARRIQSYFKKHMPPVLDRTTWEMALSAGMRRIGGSVAGLPPFDPQWMESKQFVRAWADAVKSDLCDHRMAALLAMAKAWDTERIPLRYFSDHAALAYLHAVSWKHTPRAVDLKSYQEHWRDGRGLKLGRKHGTIVRLCDHTGSKFQASAAAGLKNNLVIADFCKATPSGEILATITWVP